MRFGKATAGVLASAALMFAVPAAANAATSIATPATSANSPSATTSQFAQVARGQTVAQVDQEMGSTGNVGYFEPGTSGVDNTTEVLTWQDFTLGPLGGTALQFNVTFSSPVGQPLTVSSKTAFGIL